MRKTITLAMIVGGIALMVLGYLGSAPWGANSVSNSDPRFAFAPAVFVVGVVVAFSSALVYELMPDRHEK
jgi:Kef-type K+ transport system membrane component KefB